ncbi:MAG: hypothetical protein ACRCXM_10550, partial [Beijerinckiaceae bacterium]
PFSTTQPLVERFIFNPNTLLMDRPATIERIRNTTAVLAAVSGAALPQVIRIAKTGTNEQRIAIGEGLAIAAQRCKRRFPAMHRAIEKAARQTFDVPLLKGYNDRFRRDGVETGDRETAQRLQRARSLFDPKPVEQRRMLDLSGNAVGRPALPGLTGPDTGRIPAVR